MTNSECVVSLRNAGVVEIDGLPITQRSVSKLRNKKGQLYDIVNLWSMDRKDPNRKRIALLVKMTCGRKV